MMKRRMNLTLLLKEMRQLKVGSQLGRMMLMRKRGECNMLKSTITLIRFFFFEHEKTAISEEYMYLA